MARGRFAADVDRTGCLRELADAQTAVRDVERHGGVLDIASRDGHGFEGFAVLILGNLIAVARFKVVAQIDCFSGLRNAEGADVEVRAVDRVLELLNSRRLDEAGDFFNHLVVRFLNVTLIRGRAFEVFRSLNVVLLDIGRGVVPRFGKTDGADVRRVGRRLGISRLILGRRTDVVEVDLRRTLCTHLADRRESPLAGRIGFLLILVIIGRPGRVVAGDVKRRDVAGLHFLEDGILREINVRLLVLRVFLVRLPREGVALLTVGIGKINRVLNRERSTSDVDKAGLQGFGADIERAIRSTLRCRIAEILDGDRVGHRHGPFVGTIRSHRDVFGKIGGLPLLLTFCFQLRQVLESDGTDRELTLCCDGNALRIRILSRDLRVRRRVIDDDRIPLRNCIFRNGDRGVFTAERQGTTRFAGVLDVFERAVVERDVTEVDERVADGIRYILVILIFLLADNEVARIFIDELAAVDDDGAHAVGRQIIRLFVVDHLFLGLAFLHRAGRNCERPRTDDDLPLAVVERTSGVFVSSLPVSGLGRGGVLELEVEVHAITQLNRAGVREGGRTADLHGQGIAVESYLFFPRSIVARSHGNVIDADLEGAGVLERAARRREGRALKVRHRTIRERAAFNVDVLDRGLVENERADIGSDRQRAVRLDRDAVDGRSAGHALDINDVPLRPLAIVVLGLIVEIILEIIRKRDRRLFTVDDAVERVVLPVAERECMVRRFFISGPSRLHAQAERSADRENQRRLLRENVVRHHLVSLGF